MKKPSIARRLGFLLSFLILAAVITNNAHGQFEQIYYYTPTSTDKIYDVEIVSNQDIVMVGSTTYGTNVYLYVVKTDRYGNLIWSHIYTDVYSMERLNNESTIGYSIRESHSNTGIVDGYIIVGSFRPDGANPGNSPSQLLLKVSAINGNALWKRAYNGSNFLDAEDVAYGIEQLANTSYIFTGQVNYLATPNCFSFATYQGGDFSLIKTNRNGMYFWGLGINHSIFGANPGDLDYHYTIGHAVQETQDGGYLAVGMHDVPAIVSNYCSFPSLPAIIRRMYVVKVLDNSNNPIVSWTRTYPDPQGAGDGAYDIHKMTNGNYIIVGYSYRATRDVYVVEIDVNGNVQWGMVYDAGYNEIGYSIRETDNGFVIAGVSDKGMAGTDGLLLELDQSGNVLGAKIIESGANDELRSIRVASNEDAVTAGFSDGYGTGTYDVYLAKSDISSCDHCPGVTKQVTASEADPFPHEENYHSYPLYNSTPIMEDHDVASTQIDWCTTCLDPTKGSFQRQSTATWTDLGRDGRQLLDGTYIVLGTTEFDVTPVGKYSDILIQHLDQDGVLDLTGCASCWYKQYYIGASIYSTPSIYDEGVDPLDHHEEHAYSINPVSSGGYIVAGSVYYGNEPYYANQDTNALVFKVDATGAVSWAKEFGQRGVYKHDIARSVQEIFGGGFIVAGYSNSPFPGAPAGFNAYILRTDANGNVGGAYPGTWAYIYGGDKDDYAYHVVQTDDNDDGAINADDNDADLIPDDGFIVVGYTNSTSDFENPGIDDDIFVLKLKSNGDKEWDTFYNVGNDPNDPIDKYSDDHAYWIEEIDDDDANSLRDNGYVLVGDTKWHAEQGNNNLNIYLMRIDNNGNKVWDKSYDRLETDQIATSVEQSIDQGFILAGWTSYGAYDRSILAKTDLCGNMKWVRKYPDVATYAGRDDHAVRASGTKDGGYFAVGSTCSFTHLASKGDIHIAQTTCDGSLCNSEDIELEDVGPDATEIEYDFIRKNGDEGQDINIDYEDIDDQKTICTMEGAQSMKLTPLLPETGADVGSRQSRHNVTLYPVPVAKGGQLMVQFELPEAGVVTITVVDMTGKVVRTDSREYNEGNGTYELRTTGLEAGAYYVQVKTNSILFESGGFVIVE